MLKVFICALLTVSKSQRFPDYPPAFEPPSYWAQTNLGSAPSTVYSTTYAGPAKVAGYEAPSDYKTEVPSPFTIGEELENANYPQHQSALNQQRVPAAPSYLERSQETHPELYPRTDSGNIATLPSAPVTYLKTSNDKATGRDTQHLSTTRKEMYAPTLTTFAQDTNKDFENQRNSKLFVSDSPDHHHLEEASSSSSSYHTSRKYHGSVLPSSLPEGFLFTALRGSTDRNEEHGWSISGSNRQPDSDQTISNKHNDYATRFQNVYPPRVFFNL